MTTDVMMNAHVRDNMLWLAGTTGVITQTVIATNSGAISTSSGSAVTTSDSLSITTAGGDVLIWASFIGSNNTGAFANTLYVQRDAAGYNQLAAATEPTANYLINLAGVYKDPAPTSATHTYNTGWSVQGGTLSSSSARMILAMELRR